jgi:hypothetical protein
MLLYDRVKVIVEEFKKKTRFQLKCFKVLVDNSEIENSQ